MKLRPLEPKIDPDNPFEPDLFDRRRFADSLLRLTESCDERGLVVSLDGKWGAGKSLFVKQFTHYLDNHALESDCDEQIAHLIRTSRSDHDQMPAVCTIVFDAFEYEHLGPPVLSLVHCLEKHADHLGIEKEELNLTDFVSTFADTFDGYLQKRLVIDVKKFLRAKSGHQGLRASRSVEENGKALEHVRKSLRQLCEKIYTKTKLPAVFVIDELDRCDPNYSVGLIELVKHIFDQSRTVFFLVIQKEQLNESLKVIYGAGVDAERYWQKFVHIDVVLPSGEPRSLQHYMDFSTDRARAFELQEILRSRMGDELSRGQIETMTELLCQYIGKFAHALSLSARQLQRIFSSLVMLLSNEDIRTNNFAVLSFLVTLKIGKRELFDELISEKTPAFLIFKELGINIADIPATVTSPEYNILIFLLAASTGRQLDVYEIFSSSRSEFPVVLRHIRELEDSVNSDELPSLNEIFIDYCNQVRALA